MHIGGVGVDPETQRALGITRDINIVAGINGDGKGRIVVSNTAAAKLV